MSELKSVVHFPDGGELIITRKLLDGPGGQRMVGEYVTTYNGEPVDDEHVEELLARHLRDGDA